MPAVFPEIPVGTGFRHQSRIPPRLPEESRQSYARDNWRRLDQRGETGRAASRFRGQRNFDPLRFLPRLWERIRAR